MCVAEPVSREARRRPPTRYERGKQRSELRATQIEERGVPQAVPCIQSQCAKKGLVFKKDAGISRLCGYCVKRKCACEPIGGEDFSSSFDEEDERRWLAWEQEITESAAVEASKWSTGGVRTVL